jgi:hypothetical protein
LDLAHHLEEQPMKIKAICLTAIFAAALPAAAYADLASEVGTAQTHAGLAAKGTTVDMVHMHLHHALNCLVGPKGKGFDTTNENPCSGQGAGALSDAKGAQKTRIRTAIVRVNAGLAATTLAKAQAGATRAATAITAAEK